VDNVSFVKILLETPTQSKERNKEICFGFAKEKYFVHDLLDN